MASTIISTKHAVRAIFEVTTYIRCYSFIGALARVSSTTHPLQAEQDFVHKHGGERLLYISGLYAYRVKAEASVNGQHDHFNKTCRPSKSNIVFNVNIGIH